MKTEGNDVFVTYLWLLVPVGIWTTACGSASSAVPPAGQAGGPRSSEAGHRMEAYPQLRVVANATAGELAFGFSSCRDAGKSTFIDRIGVEEYDPAAPEHTGKFACRLDGATAADPYSVGARWTYGSVPTGYHARGCVAPLKPGTYRIHGRGPGMVVRGFELREDGSLRWLDPNCD